VIFVIRDYKFDATLKDRPKRRHGRIGLYLACASLAGVLVALRVSGAEVTDTDPKLADTPTVTSLSTPSEAAPADEGLDERYVTGKPVATIRVPVAIPPRADRQTIRTPAQDSDTDEALPKPTMSTKAPTAVRAVALLQDTPAAAAPVTAAAAPRPERPAKTHGATPESQPATAAAPSPAATPAPEDVSSPKPAAHWQSHTVAKGDTLASIFRQYGLTPRVVFQVLHASKAARQLSNIRPGQTLRFLLSEDGQLQRLVFIKNPLERLELARKAKGFSATLKTKKVEHRIASVAGTIRSSLFADGHKAGLDDKQIMALAAIFGWDIDFALQIRAGDQFRVIYDEQWVDGKKYRNGPILAAEFVNRGHTYQAFRYETRDRVAYYDAKGRSKRRAFIRTPIRFARISSRFQPRRWHPILKKWKSHKGVDYAAPKGTPIKVTGDGRVVFRGWKRGYGRVVMVRHSRKYTTVYAHMSRFRSSVKKGSRVKQGQVIGYVGQSGWATGPHLHYEFRVNNVQRDPLTVKLPKSLPLPRRQLAAFKHKIAPLTRQLASIRAATMMARNDAR
jgi:murein DD-endopeptidase MepM/ murein hydrolase activator NlpD